MSSLTWLFWEKASLLGGMVSYKAKDITKSVTKKPNKQVRIVRNKRNRTRWNWNFKLMRHSSISKGKLNKFPSRSKLSALMPLYHAPTTTPRAWRSFHTSNPKAYNVTWPKQLSCNWKLPITKYPFRVAEQNLKSSKFDFKTKTSTIQNPLSKYLQT